MSDTQALLSELARVKALFQLRTIEMHITGGPIQPHDSTANSATHIVPELRVGWNGVPSTKAIAVEQLSRMISYDGETGGFAWKARTPDLFTRDLPAAYIAAWNTKYAGKPIALKFSKSRGYWSIGVCGRNYLAHRIAFALVNGRWPITAIDHIDGNRQNNRIENIREVTALENGRNTSLHKTNTSGIAGVCWYKAYGCWVATIRDGGRRRHLGYFKKKSDAAAARKAAETALGFHENHGRARVDFTTPTSGGTSAHLLTCPAGLCLTNERN